MKGAIFASLISLLFGCEAWPPYSDELKENFAVNRHEFEELRRVMSESDFFEATYSVRLGQLQTRYDDREGIFYIDGENASDVKKLLESTKVDSARRLSDRFEFDLVSKQIWDRTYLISYVYRAKSLELKPCGHNDQKTDKGFCEIRLDEFWALEYSWYSTPQY